MQVLLNELLFSLSKALDCVESELLGVTTNHGKRVACISMRLCRALGLSDDDVFDMGCCAVLHDNALTAYMLEAGRSGISRLEGFSAHCEKGEENARAFPFVGNAADIILHHHENWNGTGFHGLAADAIPVRAAVLRLADNMDLHLALGTARPDMEADIRSHVLRFRGKLYAPYVVDALLDHIGPKLLNDVLDERIDASLAADLACRRVELSTDAMLRLCGMFAFIVDAKSRFTMLHSRGIATKAGYMGKVYGLSPEHCDRLVIAGYLHDIGKLSTPAAILEKPGPLTPEEYEIMKRHVEMTWEILKDVGGLEEICRWAASHHEKLDGNGYPRGLREHELSFECRLMACCDIYQALTEDRPYRAGMPHDKAMSVMYPMASQGMLDFGIVETMDRALRDAEI
ncbi:MAG: HD domain-containing protein [Desulfovibrionaceae bacterium]|nr:HD domain-containing protein [Desulfovibrionaceae bacterium]